MQGGAATEHRTAERKLYLCAVTGVHSNRIVGYSISDRMKPRLAVATAESAVARRGPVAGYVAHSDRGSQFRSRIFVRALDRRQRWATREQLRSAIVTGGTIRVRGIERTYHRRCRQRELGKSTPVEFNTIMPTPAAQAA